MLNVLFSCAILLTLVLSLGFLTSDAVLPSAQAITIGGLIGVDVGHCTASLPCGIHVCGDHICKLGEWEKMNIQLEAAQSNKISRMNQTNITLPDLTHLPNWLRDDFYWWTSGEITYNDYANAVNYFISTGSVKGS